MQTKQGSVLMANFMRVLLEKLLEADGRHIDIPLGELSAEDQQGYRNAAREAMWNGWIEWPHPDDQVRVLRQLMILDKGKQALASHLEGVD